MTFEAFEEAAHDMWEEIPEEYKEGIDGLVVKREAEAHEEHEDYWTLGMCFTEPYPSGYSAPDSTRSFLALFYGSFAEIADRTEDFDWDGEIWETITHELRHHLEFLAADDALEGVDYAMEEAFKRGDGEDFDPWYYQAGESVGPGIFQVEYDYYVERRFRGEELKPGGNVEFGWEGVLYSVPVPDPLGDLHFIWVNGVPSGGEVQLVLVREMRFVERVRRFLRRESLEVMESEADARRIPPATDTVP